MGISYQLEYHSGYNIWHRHVMPYMPQHMHRNVEIIYLKEGHTTCTVNLIEYELNAGDILFVFPEQLHSYADATGDLENYVLLFPPDIPFFDNVFQSMIPICPVLRGIETQEIEKIFYDACNATFKKNYPFIEGARQGYTSVILSKLISLLPLQEKSMLAKNVESRLIRYCTDHFNEPISLASLADEFGYTPTYFSRIFNVKFKTGFAQFINSLRIEEAKLMLKKEKSMSEIAFACGFSSIRNFNLVFKEITGKSPSEYRKKIASPKSDTTFIPR